MRVAADCLFCKIVAGDAPADRIGDDDGVIAFRDISPRAPVHVLIVPEQHLDSAHALTDEHAEVLMACFRLARRVADDHGIADGYRITTNIGTRGGQAIPHLHFHVLGGRQLHHIDSGDPPTDG